MFDIQEEVKKLPGKPGVYIMHDSKDNIIYVGKAINLKNRVSQYFRPSTPHTAKITKMVSLVHHFEYIVVDTEQEALVLECNLIKEYRPKYNTMLKDDKSYPFIRVSVEEDFPRVMFARKSNVISRNTETPDYYNGRKVYAGRRIAEKSRYFGPYTCSEAVHDTLELLRRLYSFRTCSQSIFEKVSGQMSSVQSKQKACLYYHIGQCSAPCIGAVSKDEYRKSIDDIIYFLEGHTKQIEDELKQKMLDASVKMEFEKAAVFRDMVNDIEKLMQSQKINDSDDTDRDVISYAISNDEALVQVFFVRKGKILGREHFYLTGVLDEDGSDIIVNFIKQYYSGTPYLPREILSGREIREDDKMELETWLSAMRGGKVEIINPKKGAKEALVTLAEKNALMVLEKDSDRIKDENAKNMSAQRELSKILDIPLINRIESFDISNTNGFESVGSMVVFENGKPKKNDYRKFRIKTVTGPDDYASMNEVLTRRFEHGMKERKELSDKHIDENLGSFTRYPDIILMDGGRGQVNIALKVLSLLGITGIAVCGMVKDDHHRTRGLYYNNLELPIDTHSECFYLITRIQDETHRFAITYHQLLRSKEQVHSVLDDIRGIGEVRKMALIKQMGSLEKIKGASVEELSQAEGMDLRSAQAVFDFFHIK